MFDSKLEFDLTLIRYIGDDSWVEKAIIDAHECLNGNVMPEPSPDCDYCNYYPALIGASDINEINLVSN